LTLAFAGIAIDAASAGRWLVAVPTALIGAWMGSFALAAMKRALRRTRR
jgi:hypothetical protein